MHLTARRLLSRAFEHSGCIDSGRQAVPQLSRLATVIGKRALRLAGFLRPDISKYCQEAPPVCGAAGSAGFHGQNAFLSQLGKEHPARGHNALNS
jgi:hypothetical protein